MATGLNTNGIKFDGSPYSINTWYNILETMGKKEQIEIINQGVNNDLETGKLYISTRTDNVTETASINAPRIIPFFPGDNKIVEHDEKIRKNIKIWVLADTLNLCCNISYFEGY
jgi:hypothetical protein